VIDNAFEI